MIRVTKPKSMLIIAITWALFLLGGGPLSVVSAAKAETADVTVKVDGKTVKLADPAFIYGNRLYVPVVPMAGALGAKASWDKKNEELTLKTSSGDKAVLGNGVPVVYYNNVRYKMEAPPFLKQNRLYMPLRQLAELLHARLSPIAGPDVVDVITAKREEAKAASAGIVAVSMKAGATKKPALNMKPAEPYTQSDYMLLAKITMVEAGYEPFEGQLAVANVILNRVKSKDFPGTIRDVIYSGSQFPPAHNGLLDKSKPNASALRAAKDALNGRNNVGDAVYFYDPDVSGGPFWSSLDVVATIGSHRFAK